MQIVRDRGQRHVDNEQIKIGKHQPQRNDRQNDTRPAGHALWHGVSLALAMSMGGRYRGTCRYSGSRPPVLASRKQLSGRCFCDAST